MIDYIFKILIRILLMKKSKNLKALKKDVKTFSKNLSSYIDNIKKEYDSNYNKSIDNLLKKIADGENLEYNYLKEKYILKNEDSLEGIMLEEEEDNLELFDKVVIDDISYFYENKEGGKIFNTEAEEVGIYKENNFVLNS